MSCTLVGRGVYFDERGRLLPDDSFLLVAAVSLLVLATHCCSVDMIQSRICGQKEKKERGRERKRDIGGRREEERMSGWMDGERKIEKDRERD